MGVQYHEIFLLLMKLLKHVPLGFVPSIGWAILW